MSQLFTVCKGFFTLLAADFARLIVNCRVFAVSLTLEVLSVYDLLVGVGDGIAIGICFYGCLGITAGASVVVNCGRGTGCLTLEVILGDYLLYIVMRCGLAVLKGLFTLCSAYAGVEVGCLMCAVCFSVEVLSVNYLLVVGVCKQLAVFLATSGTYCLLCAGCGAAGVSQLFTVCKGFLTLLAANFTRLIVNCRVFAVSRTLEVLSVYDLLVGVTKRAAVCKRYVTLLAADCTRLIVNSRIIAISRTLEILSISYLLVGVTESIAACKCFIACGTAYATRLVINCRVFAIGGRNKILVIYNLNVVMREKAAIFKGFSALFTTRCAAEEVFCKCGTGCTLIKILRVGVLRGVVVLAGYGDIAANVSTLNHVALGILELQGKQKIISFEFGGIKNLQLNLKYFRIADGCIVHECKRAFIFFHVCIQKHRILAYFTDPTKAVGKRRLSQLLVFGIGRCNDFERRGVVGQHHTAGSCLDTFGKYHSNGYDVTTICCFSGYLGCCR